MNFSGGFLTIFEVMGHCENLIKATDSNFPQKRTDTRLPVISRDSSTDPYRSHTLWTQEGDSRKSQANEKRMLKS